MIKPLNIMTIKAYRIIFMMQLLFYFILFYIAAFTRSSKYRKGELKLLTTVRSAF